MFVVHGGQSDEAFVARLVAQSEIKDGVMMRMTDSKIP